MNKLNSYFDHNFREPVINMIVCKTKPLIYICFKNFIEIKNFDENSSPCIDIKNS